MARETVNGVPSEECAAMEIMARAGKYPALPQIDFEAYLPFLEDQDIPMAQKRELIETLFGVLTCFADIAFGLSPMQNACGKLAKIESESQFPAKTMIKSENRKTRKQFKDAAKGGQE